MKMKSTNEVLNELEEFTKLVNKLAKEGKLPIQTCFDVMYYSTLSYVYEIKAGLKK